jgi:hypothetical protein
MCPHGLHCTPQVTSHQEWTTACGPTLAKKLCPTLANSFLLVAVLCAWSCVLDDGWLLTAVFSLTISILILMTYWTYGSAFGHRFNKKSISVDIPWSSIYSST